MDKKNELTQEELALIKGDSVLNSLSTFIEQGTDVALSAFNSEVVATTWETIRVISENLVEASKVITVFRKVASIPDKLFLNKMEKYCEGLFEIPLDKRNKYVKKVGKARLNEDSAFILGILNKIEELSKLQILLILFEAKIDDKIDDNTYRRLMILVDRTMYSDLIYLLAHITTDYIKIENDAEQGLLANGWLIYAGQTCGSATEEGYFVYNYCDIARVFCNIVKEYTSETEQ